MADNQETHWKLLHYLDKESEANIVLIILNRPLKSQLDWLHCLWNKAMFKATVDGGANEVYDNTEDNRDRFVPDVITGDFDSVRPDVLEFYKSKGVETIKTEDQDYTDFTKCLKVVTEKLKNRKIDCIFVLGAFGGRVDQIFANIDSLYQAQKLLGCVQICLLSKSSLACLLPKGKHHLHVTSGMEREWCGLIPVGGACHNVTTTGLKWNLAGHTLKFGELVSTSNTWDGSSVVTIATEDVLMWTMGIRCPKSS